MRFVDAIRAAGMMPPEIIRHGRFERFPGIGKGKGNSSGWCKLISETLGIYGDWASGLSDVWVHGGSIDDIGAAKAEIRRYQQQNEKFQRREHAQAAIRAAELIKRCSIGPHDYLTRKGFPDAVGLIDGEALVIPLRDMQRYRDVISVQRVSADGGKKFLPGGRTKGGIHRLGSQGGELYFCEGYATGLTIAQALKNLHRYYAVVVCFSANNLTHVARQYGQGWVMADNDVSLAGRTAAEATGLRWAMPENEGMDFNDLHQAEGITAVERVIRNMQHE